MTIYEDYVYLSKKMKILSTLVCICFICTHAWLQSLMFSKRLSRNLNLEQWSLRFGFQLVACLWKFKQFLSTGCIKFYFPFKIEITYKCIAAIRYYARRIDLRKRLVDYFVIVEMPCKGLTFYWRGDDSFRLLVLEPLREGYWRSTGNESKLWNRAQRLPSRVPKFVEAMLLRSMWVNSQHAPRNYINPVTSRINLSGS